MSEKINVFRIIKCHISTFVEHPSGRPSWMDYTTFAALPLAIAVVAFLLGYVPKEGTINLIVTAGAIFIGLLLNLLILIYDQRSKVPVEEPGKQWNDRTRLRVRVLDELYYNISYCAVASIFMVTVAILLSATAGWAFSLRDLEVRLDEVILTPLLVFLASNLGLTILMVLKRTYSLLERN